MKTDLFDPNEIARFHLNAIVNLVKPKLSLAEIDELYYHYLRIIDREEEP